MWRAHNSINKRLSGEASDDPKFPKRQFPPSEICPQCWNGSEFDEDKTFEFLLNYYSNIHHDNIRVSLIIFLLVILC